MATDSPTESRALRLRALLDELLLRREAGEAVSDESVMVDHPDLMPELAEQLRFLQLLQVTSTVSVSRSSGTRSSVRCPECHEPVERSADEDAGESSELRCGSCDARFRLVEDRDETASLCGVRIGEFTLLDKIGSGAFGSVYLAHDARLNRQVAIKVPRKAQLSEADVDDFVREARVAATLNHPNIVRVHEVGRHEGRIYIVTDFVDGCDLSQWIELVRPSSHESAAMCAKLAEALEHAHSRNVIHRDLKPSNVMLNQAGEPFLLDFGLAKHETTETTVTVDGKLIGTPAYMSPEQARGAADRVDHRTDVYSLGVLLFELLAGQRPFQGNTRILLHQILFEDAPTPRRWNPSIPRDLETICLKCLEKDPQRRYASAEDLRQDLQRFLRHEPVLARPIGRIHRLSRWCHRNPRFAALAALTLSLLLMFAVFGQLAALNFREQARAIVAERQRADQVERQRRLDQVDALLNAAPDQIRTILDEIQRDRELLLPEVEARYHDQAINPRTRLRLAYAMAVLGQPDLNYLMAAAVDAPSAEQRNLSTVMAQLGPSAQVALADAFDRETEVDKRVRLAALLLATGDPRACRDVLALREDPSLRTSFIVSFPEIHGDLSNLPELLATESDAAFRSGICCALGMLQPQTLDASISVRLRQTLEQLYQFAADAATHGAAGSALQRWAVPLPELEASVDPDSRRSWFVNPLGMTMVRIEPDVFSLGDPPGGPIADGVVKTVMTRGFWISDTEVTLEQYRPFLDAIAGQLDQLDPPPRTYDALANWCAGPNHSVPVTWFEAAQFCNWLSIQHGRTPCYSQDTTNPSQWSVNYAANGYRLPTDAEWEFVCRAGTSTSYATGDDALSSLIHFAHIVERQPAIGRSKLPNAWGVFDMLGNAWEWCSDITPRLKTSGSMLIDPRGETPLDYRTLRGGAFDSGTWDLISARRILDGPQRITRTQGMRIVCADSSVGTGEQDVARAVTLLDNVVDQHQTEDVVDPILLHALWQWLAQPDEQTRSITIAERLGQQRPLLASPLAVLTAEIFANRQDWPAAEQWFRRATEHAPQEPNAYLDLAYAMVEQGKASDARRVLEQCQSQAGEGHPCLALCGQDESIVIPKLPLHQCPELTIEFWVRSWHGQLFSHGEIKRNRGINLTLGPQRSWASSPAERFLHPSHASWFHLAMVVNANQQQFFDQGKPMGAMGVGSLPEAPDSIPTRIGWRIPGHAGRGLIRAIRISKVARYDAAFEPEPVLKADEHTLLLYDFHELEGDQVLDQSGNGYHGRIERAD